MSMINNAACCSVIYHYKNENDSVKKSVYESTDKKKAFSILLFSFFCCTIILPSKVQAQGDLLLYPKRVVFEGSKKSRELSLANTGKDTARYVISIVQIRMKEDGGFETISKPDSGQNFADKNFRFFPGNVVLARYKAI